MGIAQAQQSPALAGFVLQLPSQAQCRHGLVQRLAPDPEQRIGHGQRRMGVTGLREVALLLEPEEGFTTCPDGVSGTPLAGVDARQGEQRARSEHAIFGAERFSVRLIGHVLVAQRLQCSHRLLVLARIQLGKREL